MVGFLRVKKEWFVLRKTIGEGFGAWALLSRVSRIASGLPMAPTSLPNQNSANPTPPLSTNAKRQRRYESSEVGTSNAVSVPPLVANVQRPNFQLSPC